MSASYPPLPPELVEFARTGVSILVGTCSHDLVPACVRGMGVRIWPDACHLTLIVPARSGAAGMKNLETNPRLAVTLSNIATHRTVQLKGQVLAVRGGSAEDRELAERYRAMFAEDLAFAGLPEANTFRVSIWPCYAVDLRIDVVFGQTPGPSAGVKLPMPEGRL